MNYSFEEAVSQLKDQQNPVFIINKPLRFIIDAQLPKTLSDFLKDNGHNSIHTPELPDKIKLQIIIL